MNTSRALAAVACGTLASAMPALAGPNYTFAGLGFGGRAEGLSADGSTVVGFTGVIPQPFKWNELGLQILPPLTGHDEGFATAASHDGSIVVGESLFRPRGRAARWSDSSPDPDNLGIPAGQINGDARAFGVSADGSVVVGGWNPIGGHERAFRWVEGVGMQDLTSAFGGMARGVSADGAIVVGGTYLTANLQAFRWTQAGGLQGLGTLPGTQSSMANAISADGSTIVGVCTDASGGTRAFRWTSESGGEMVSLGEPLFGNHIEALATTADGGIIVGRVGLSLTDDTSPFLWTAAGGLVDLQDHLTSLGLDLTGWDLIDATGISADGRILTGSGLYEVAPGSFTVMPWIAIIPAPAAAQAFAGAALLAARRRRRNRPAPTPASAPRSARGWARAPAAPAPAVPSRGSQGS